MLVWSFCGEENKIEIHFEIGISCDVKELT